MALELQFRVWMKKWITLIQSNLTELFDLEENLVTSSRSEEADLLFYTRVMINYYRENPAGIESLLNSQSFDSAALKLLAEMRLAILRNESLGEITRLQIAINAIDLNDLIKGESLFVAAFAHQKIGDFVVAETLFRESGAYLKKVGAHNKFLRARMSAIAAFSCIYPDSRLFSEYLSVYQSAILSKENLTAGTCLLNISREFQRLEAWDLALEYANQSLHLLEDGHYGSREFGLSLVHRAYLLLQMKCSIDQLSKDLMIALSITHPDVQSSCASLAEMFQVNLKFLPLKTDFLPTWKERKAEMSVQAGKLGEMESQLIVLLAEKPHSKFELLDLLFGDRIDHESRENRFKNLLFRVRTRTKADIRIINGNYTLSEPSTVGKKIG